MKFFVEHGYDFACYDFRGFGKSTGTIENEDQFYDDAQLVLDSIRSKYKGKELIVGGYSVGSATATKLIAENKATKLILMAPYYSMTELAADHYPFFPSFLVNYKFETFAFLSKSTCPVILFHGQQDGIIPFSNSQELQKIAGDRCKLVLIKDVGHNGIGSSDEFQKNTAAFLEESIK